MDAPKKESVTGADEKIIPGKRHIPTDLAVSERYGIALCGRYVRYVSNDHGFIRELALINPDPEIWCKDCLRVMYGRSCGT